MKLFRKILLFFTFIAVHSIVFGQTADITDGCAPLTVNFTPPNGASSFFWDFGDGASSILSSPSNTYLNPGTYTVEFKNSATGPVVGTITIRVFAKPDPKISIDNRQGCLPLNASFNDETSLSPSVSVNTYTWVFGDGGTASGKNASHTFFSSGDYFVSLALTTNLPSCNVTKRFDDIINVSDKPNVNYITSPNPPSSCTAPFTVKFTNTSTAVHPLSFVWDFDNGNSSNARNPNDQTYPDGSFDVKLIATDTNTCSDSITQRVSVGAPTASFEVDDTVCLNAIDTIINTSSSGINTWTFGSGVRRIGTVKFKDPEVEYIGAGPQTISLTVSAGACSSTASKTIFVEEVDSTFTSTPTYSCSFPATVSYSANSNGVGNTYFWTFGNDSTSDLKNPTAVFLNKDTTIHSINGRRMLRARLQVTSPRGCTAGYTAFDTVHLPNALLMPDIVDGCVPLDVVFYDSSTFDVKKPNKIIEWDWRFGDGTTPLVRNTGDPVTHTYTQIGEYKAFLIVDTELGCKDTSYEITIKVGDKINLDFSVQPTEICLGETVQFTDLTPGPLGDSIDAWHYYSESDRSFSCFDEANPSWTFKSESGMHDVNFTAGFNGCYSELLKTDLINVKGATAKIDYFYDCASPLEVQFRDSSINASSIEWKFGDGNNAFKSDTAYEYASSGNYEVILEAENPSSGCASDFDTMMVKVRKVKARIVSGSLFCLDERYEFDASTSTDAYTGCSEGSVRAGYTWVFDDDPDRRRLTTDSLISGFRFKDPGNQTILLIATDINGCMDTARKKIKVFGVNADFLIDKDTICVPTEVNFDEQSTADTTLFQWRWSYGDGDNSTFILPTDPSHTYELFFNPALVTLIAEDVLGCADTLSKFIRMYKPSSEPEADDTTVCVGIEVPFTTTDYTDQGSNLDFAWDFGDGNSSNLQNPVHTYTSAGIYNVKLIYEELATGCTDSTVIGVEARDFPIAGFETSGDTIPTICPNSTILFTDTSISSNSLDFKWDFGNGDTSGFQNPGAIYTSNATYKVQQIVSVLPARFGCADTATRDLLVRGPIGDFVTNMGGEPICRLESVLFNLKDTTDVDTWTWDFGDGSSATDLSPVNHQYTFIPPSGQTVAKLEMTNFDGSCPATSDTIIDLFDVIANFQRNDGIDTGICFAPYPLTNLSIGATEWFWDFGDGTTTNIQSPFTHSYQNPGTYSIILGVRNTQLGCTDTIVKEVVLHPIPDPISVGDTICEGETVTTAVLNPNTAWTYVWQSTPATLITNANAAVSTSQPLINSTYIVEITDTNLCKGSDTIDVIVFNPLNIMDLDTIIIVGDKVTLPVFADPELYNFQWTPEKGLSCLDCLPPYVRPLDDTLYHIDITDILGCFPEDGDFNIRVHPETFIRMPKAFSPNDDRINDAVFVEGWGIKELLEYQIYNRWGELIFETTDIEQGWDGRFKGEIQNNDVYVYKVRVKTWRDEEKTLEGYIKLMR